MQEWFPVFFLVAWCLHWGALLMGQNFFPTYFSQRSIELIYFLGQYLLVVYALQVMYFGWQIIEWYVEWSGTPLRISSIPEALRVLVLKYTCQAFLPLGSLLPFLRKSKFFQLMLGLVFFWSIPFLSLDSSTFFIQMAFSVAWFSFFYGFLWILRIRPIYLKSN